MYNVVELYRINVSKSNQLITRAPVVMNNIHSLIVKQDLKVCGLSEAGTQDRLSWRSSVKNSRQEPTPSNGNLPQSMAAPPARRVLGMRTRSFNKTGFD